jgi:hypothetical protein
VCPLNFVGFFTARVVSKEIRLLVLSRTFCNLVEDISNYIHLSGEWQTFVVLSGQCGDCQVMGLESQLLVREVWDVVNKHYIHGKYKYLIVQNYRNMFLAKVEGLLLLGLNHILKTWPVGCKVAKRWDSLFYNRSSSATWGMILTRIVQPCWIATGGYRG